MNRGRIFSRVCAIVIGASAVIGATARPAGAATVYTYTGNRFNTHADSTPPAGSYDGSMFVSGRFVVGSPLAGGLDNEQIEPSLLAFSFNDGRTTLTKPTTNTASFVISTDSLGDITDWAIFLQTIYDSSFPGAQSTQITTVYYAAYPGTVSDSGSIFECIHFSNGTCDQKNSDYAFSFFNAGSWSVAQTPLPAALPLFGSALGVMGLLGWRRKRKTVAAVATA